MTRPRAALDRDRARPELGPAPCDACAHARRCATELRACRDFGHYVHTGKVRSENRRATATLYRAFGIGER